MQRGEADGGEGKVAAGHGAKVAQPLGQGVRVAVVMVAGIYVGAGFEQQAGNVEVAWEILGWEWKG